METTPEEEEDREPEWSSNIGGLEVIIHRTGKDYFMTCGLIGYQGAPLEVPGLGEAITRTTSIMQVHFEETADRLASGYYRRADDVYPPGRKLP